MQISAKKVISPSLNRSERKALMETVQAFDATTRKRGIQYLLDGHVEKIRGQSTGFTAHIRGSTLYQVSWSKNDAKWRNTCTCPLNGNCKHAYAVAQYVLQYIDPAKEENADLSYHNGEIDTHMDRLISIIGKEKTEVSHNGTSSKSIVSKVLESRNPWDAIQHIPALLKQVGIPFEEIDTPDNHWLSFMKSDRREKRAWLLAREILKYSNLLPTELESYRHHKIFEREETKKKEDVLVSSIQNWIRTLSSPSPQFQRAIRIQWSWDSSSCCGTGPQITFLLSGKKSKDAPRTFQQMCGFAWEAIRSPHLFSTEDTEFLRWLELQSNLLLENHPPSSSSTCLAQSGRALHAWLTAWGQSQRCFWEDGSPVRYENTAVQIVPEISLSNLNADQDQIKTKLPFLHFAIETPDGKHHPFHEARLVLPPNGDSSKEPTFIFINGAFHPVKSSPPQSVLRPFLEGEKLPISEQKRSILLSPLLTRFPNLTGNLEDLVCYHPVQILFSFLLQPNDWLCVRLFAVSHKTKVRWEFTREGWLPNSEVSMDGGFHLEPIHFNGNHDSSALKIKDSCSSITEGKDETPESRWNQVSLEHLPDPTQTKPAREWIETLGVQDSEEAGFTQEHGWWTFLNEKRIETLFAQWNSRPSSTEYWANPAFRNLFMVGQRPWPKLKIRSSGMDWFSISTEWDSLTQNITAADLKKLRVSESKFIKLSNGQWMNRDEAGQLQTTLEAMADLGLDPSSKEPQRLTLWQIAGSNQKNLRKWLENLDVEKDSETKLAPKELQTRLENFQGLPDIDLPHRMQVSMRPYQLDGLKFLSYVPSLQLGAILADDMGLGKTIQALAWIEHLCEQKGAAPCLVVCPASVVYNWQREAEKFVPGMKILSLIRGEARHSLRKEIPKHDLIITNYALLRYDLEELKQFEFRAVILDEAQNIKNPDSIVARASKQLKAVHRLALTGTPLENHLTDLWSIIDFVSPGYLGTRTHFLETYDVPDEPHRRRLLASRLRPILLRRIKRDVAPDLPERIEERMDCELTHEQRALYISELQKARTMISEHGGEEAALRKKIHVLAALTRLRQICCHPALAGGKLDVGSGKTDSLFEIIEPLIAEGHKVLVFSQFVRMLHLLQDEMDKRSIPYHILTGKTSKREAVVKNFQEDPNACIFLLSLRAAGTGLNLTAASYVVLYDPWWNPAVEAQAIDRTHRIGQDRTVITYRLVAKGTVEDKIYELQRRKASVVKEVLGEEGFARTLTRDDLRFLFAD